MRTKPYTERGIRRVPCARCGRKLSRQQWQICSDGNLWRALCNGCDIALNELVLRFMHIPHRGRMAAYRAKIKLLYG